MPPSVVVRPVQSSESSDAAEWLRMRLALWPNSTAEIEKEGIDHFLAGSSLPFPQAAFVSPRPTGGLCGLAEVSIHTDAPVCVTDRIGYLEAWYVDSDMRGQGIGRALAEAAEAWARAQGCREMASDTDPSYPLSPAAHAALGYAEVERYFRKELT